MPLPSVFKTNHFLGIVSALVLFAGGVAIADIITGLSTTSSSSNVTITNLTLNKPVDVAVGDLMLASVAIHDGNAIAVATPAGWTQILRSDNETNVSIVTYWKVAGVSEPSSYVWTLSPQTRAQGGITRYSGVDTSNPIDVAAGNIGRGTVATTSSVTTTATNEMVVAVYALHVGGLNHAGDFFSVPAGMTERYDTSYTAAGPTVAEFDGVQAVAGSTGIKTSDIAGNKQRDWTSQIIALRPEVPSTLANGLIHYWKLDEASGDAFDIVGSMTMTNVNSTQYAPGKINNAADIEYSNSNVLRSSVDLTSVPLTSYSMCMWYKPESTPAEGTAYSLWTSYDSPGLFDVLYVNPSDGPARLLFRQFLPDLADTAIESIGELQTNAYTHICATWNGAQTEMYLLGTSVETPQAASTIRTDVTTGTTIGGQSTSDTAVFNVSDGVIDEVGFWTRALTATEIGELYNAGQGISYPF